MYCVRLYTSSQLCRGPSLIDAARIVVCTIIATRRKVQSRQGAAVPRTEFLGEFSTVSSSIAPSELRPVIVAASSIQRMWALRAFPRNHYIADSA